MTRPLALLLAATIALAACTSTPEPQFGPDGKPLPTVYRIAPGSLARIQFRMLDSVNSLRAAAGAPQLALNSSLNAAAETHSRDMSLQNRPWHFGSDGSSPLDRAARAGYPGIMRGENISETYETELETLAAWMDQVDTRDVILDPRSTDLGFAYFQDSNGKIWWTLVTGGPGVVQPQLASLPPA